MGVWRLACQPIQIVYADNVLNKTGNVRTCITQARSRNLCCSGKVVSAKCYERVSVFVP